MIPVLDSLRAFAALSVCLFHFVCTTTGFIHNETLLKVFDVGQYGVQLFFVISGFVIPWAMYNAGFEFRDFFRFLLKRLVRLEPPYIVSILLALTVLYAREKLLGRNNDHIEVSANQVVLHLGYLIPFFEGYKWLNTVYWTLAVEFQYYILMALLFTPLIKANWMIRVSLYLSLAIVSFFLPEKFLPYWLPVFLLGILLFLRKSELIMNTEYLAATILTLTLCFFKYPFASVIYAIVPLVCVSLYGNKKITGLHFAGKFSYSIYLIHPIIGASFINILSHKMTGSIEKTLCIAGGILVTLISAWLLYFFVEKPSKMLSASIKY